jgi:hypothetical protein
MNSLVMGLAVNCVRGWTWLYTWRMPPAFRETRRAEIDSDLWEFQGDGAGDHRLGSALHILLRLLIGIPDDSAFHEVGRGGTRIDYSDDSRAVALCLRKPDVRVTLHVEQIDIGRAHQLRERLF